MRKSKLHKHSFSAPQRTRPLFILRKGNLNGGMGVALPLLDVILSPKRMDVINSVDLAFRNIYTQPPLGWVSNISTGYSNKLLTAFTSIDGPANSAR